MMTVIACLPVALGVLNATGTVYAPESASREERFANPPACSRILPLRHGWPYDLAKVDSVLQTLQEEGFGGFAGNVNWTSNYLHDVAGWGVFRHAVEKAHELGMKVWLYDEKGYPSGTAGGQVLDNQKEQQARAFLVSVTNDLAGSLKVVGITDDYIYAGTQAAEGGKLYKCPYPNILMREPTERFVGLTHEAYRRELGPALGFIDSTFTDEPSLKTFWVRQMPYLCLPVSDELLESYESKFGHSLKDDVPALIAGEPVGRTAAIRHRYWTMIADRVAENYFGQLAKWSSENGMLSGGHLLHEGMLTAHVPLYGDFFRALRGLSAPGCDMLTSIPATVSPLTPLFAGSAGELNGARRVMSESSDHIQRHRAPGDKRPPVQVTARQIVGSLNRQIWGGINTFTSYYRWDTFSSEERRSINEEIGRTVTLVSEGHSAAEVAILYPADALMCGFEPQKYEAGGALAQRIANCFDKAIRTLFMKGYSLLIVDTETIAGSEVKGGALVRGPLVWRTVVLPSAITLPRAVARKLSAFQENGGQVIVLGDRPVNSENDFPDEEVISLSARWTYLSQELAACLPEAISAHHTLPLSVTRGPEGILRVAHRRTAKDGDIFFVANDSSDFWTGAVRVVGDPQVRVWNPRVGLSWLVAGEIPLELPPYAAVVLTTAEVHGQLMPNNQKRFAFKLRTLDVPRPLASTISKGTYVNGSIQDLSDGFVRADTELTKGDVDTFAFVSRTYDQLSFPSDAKGLSFSVRVPKGNYGNARLGVLVMLKDKTSFFASTGNMLVKPGTQEIVCLFADFRQLGSSSLDRMMRLRPEDIWKIGIGYAGYYGHIGEKIMFDVSLPSACMLTMDGE